MSSQTTSTEQSAITDVRSLSIAQRVELMGDIWDSLIADGWRPPLSDEFKAELRRRVEDDLAHPEKSVSWEDVKRAAHGSR